MTDVRARAASQGFGRNRGLALFATLFVALALLAFGRAANAQANAIESVSMSMQGGSTTVRIQMKNAPAAVPPSFTVANPPRLALDFADTANAVPTQPIEFAQGEARSVNVVQAASRTRVVMNLRRPVTHSATIDGKTVVVTLEPISGVTVSAVAPPSTQAFVFNKPEGASSQSLRDIDFRRGKDGEGRVVVELSNPQTGVDVRQQGQTIVVDFLKTRLPENLRRRLDVADFGTPVRAVRTTQNGDNVRMVIEPTGLWEHNAYQSDTQFVVEVKSFKEDPSKLIQGTRGGYRGDRLSLNFQNVDVRALLQVIADFTNLNIVVRDSVAGSITLRLKDVPWDQALDIVLQSKNLDMRKNGNVILVAPREELATQEKIELESKQQISEIEPSRLETFQLNYQKAESVARMLGDDKQRVLSKSGSAVPDIRTNKVFVRDTSSRLEEVRRIIQQLDVPVRQVLIEARIVEADDRFSRNLGVKLGFNDIRSTVYRTGSTIDPVTGTPTAINIPVYGAGTPLLGSGAYSTVAGNLQGVADLSSQLGSGLSGQSAQGLGQATALNNTNFVNLPASGISGVNAASFAVSLFGSSLTRFVNLEISALEAEQRGKVVSSPRVLTSDQGKAIIEQGTELPYQTATSSGATSVTFRKANLKLEVVPQITPEGNVIMKVQVNRDAVGQLTPAGFAIDTRSVNTEVLVENGGTVVIGGIYEQFERTRVNKVPVLGDIPYLGNLFKNRSRTSDRTELLVFLTPRVVTELATSAAR
ncbi:MAG: AMIN domain-containing protein [Burkholderiales bacterium]|jgi:type IV pilus assembly protein PilQ